MLRKLATSCLLAALGMPAVARTRPHYGDTLRVEVAGDPWQFPDGPARRLVFDGLTELDSNGNIQPGLAIAWTSENGDRRWVFRMRSGVHFHDGSSATPSSIAASLSESCSTKCPWGNVRALNSSLVFTADEPMPQLPGLLAGDEFLISKNSSSGAEVGTGPFQVAADANGILTLAANDSSWQERSFVDAIEVRGHRAVSDQWLDLAAGRADVVEVPIENIRQAQQQHLNVTISGAPVEIVALQVAASNVLADLSLRSAVAYAIDRTALANVIFQKQAKPAASLLPQNVSGFAFLFTAQRDVNKARELRGSESRALSLAVEGGGAFQLAAQRIVLNLREAGFNVQLAPSSGRPSDLTLRTFRIASSDPSCDLVQILHDAGDAAPAIGPGPDTIYNAEREYLARRTLIPLVHLPRAYAIGSRVHNFQLRFDGAPDLGEVSLEATK